MSNAVSSRTSWAGKARVFMAAISMMLALVLLGMTAKGGLANEGDTTRLSVGDGGIQGNYGSFNPSVSGPNGRFVAFESEASNLVPGVKPGPTDPKDPSHSTRNIFVLDRLGGMDAVSLADSSTTVLGNYSSNPSISADGRYVAFESAATNLVAGDTNASTDVFVRDRQTGTTELVSVNSSGVQWNSRSSNPSISADGRYVAFELGPGGYSNYATVLVRDRLNKTTELVSASTSSVKELSGVKVNSHSYDPSISADGSIVAFETLAGGVVAGDTNASTDVFVRNRLNKTTKRVSVNNSGAQGNGHSYDPSISADGNTVAFESAATNLVAGDTNAFIDVFVHRAANDATQKGTTQRASVGASGVQGNWNSSNPSVAEDGSIVAFDSHATNLVPNDTNGATDVFQHEPDYTAPAAPTISSPIQGARLNVRSFSVSGTAEANSTVKLFEGALSKGTTRADAYGKWRITLSGVVDGSHSYLAKATDQAGNTSAPSSTRTVIVDTTKPKVISAEPFEDATAIAPDANVYATFSEAMRASTINVWNFKLYKNEDSTTALTATVSYDATAKKATLNPSADLEAGVTYKVLVTTGTKDLAGNVLDQDPTLTGAQPKVWYFTVSP